MRALTRSATVALLLASTRPVAAQLPPSSPARELNRHLFEKLEKRPWRAFGWELLFPGGGNVYTGLYVPAAVTLGLSLVGASLWIAGAARDQRSLEAVGMGTFAAARSYGLVSAPIGAVLLNAAFRHQLGLVARF